MVHYGMVRRHGKQKMSETIRTVTMHLAGDATHTLSRRKNDHHDEKRGHCAVYFLRTMATAPSPCATLLDLTCFVTGAASLVSTL